MRQWHDRVEAGQELARALKRYEGQDAIVYALPRGGVVLAAEVSKELEAPLDLLIPRKIGHPANPEYAIAAITEEGQPIFGEENPAHFDQGWLANEIKRQTAEAVRRRKIYTEGKPRQKATNKVAIIIDDGIATGLTMLAAIRQVKEDKPAKVVVAVPVSPEDTAVTIKAEANDFICLHIATRGFGAVGSYYQFFEQVEDEEVVDILAATYNS